MTWCPTKQLKPDMFPTDYSMPGWVFCYCSSSPVLPPVCNTLPPQMPLHTALPPSFLCAAWCFLLKYTAALNRRERGFRRKDDNRSALARNLVATPKRSAPLFGLSGFVHTPLRLPWSLRNSTPSSYSTPRYSLAWPMRRQRRHTARLLAPAWGSVGLNRISRSGSSSGIAALKIWLPWPAKMTAHYEISAISLGLIHQPDAAFRRRAADVAALRALAHADSHRIKFRHAPPF